MKTCRYLSVFGAAFSPLLWAAGGHHAVDDAEILEAGECQVESWVEFLRGGDELWQVGPACNLGGVEWTLSYERFRVDGGDSFNAVTPEAKIARDLGNGWAVGGAVGATYDGDASRWQTMELRLPVTWFAHDLVAVHATAAHFFERGDDNAWFWGLASDITLPADFELLVEAFREANEWFGRVGLRYFLPFEGLIVDLSYAASEEGGGDRITTVGLTWEFDRP